MNFTHTLIDEVTWLPQHKFLRESLILSFGTAMLVALTQIQIPMAPVPITGQSLAVLLIGASFGAKRAVGTTVCYLALGLFGLPVFAGGTAGLARLTGVTGGYLLGFVVAAYLMGLMSEKGLDRSIKNALWQFTVGHSVIFLCGVLWLSYFLGVKEAVYAGFLPFIPGMIIKTVIAALVIPSLWKFVKKA